MAPVISRDSDNKALYLQTSSWMKLSIVPDSTVQSGGVTDAPKIVGPVATDDPGIVGWNITKQSSATNSNAVLNQFVVACGDDPARRWNHIFCPYTSTTPRGMYFYFAVKIEVNLESLYLGSSTFYVGQCPDGTRFPWWAGGSDIQAIASGTVGGLTIRNPTTCTHVNSTVFQSQYRNDVHEIDFLFSKFNTN